VAGGHSLVRAARSALAVKAGFQIVADTDDAAEAAHAAALCGASLALVDLNVAGGCVPAVRKLVDRVPGIAVLVVASELDPRVLLAVVRAGAEGLVTEAAGAEGFGRAVEAALNGEAVIPRDGVAALIDEVRAQAGGAEVAAAEDGEEAEAESVVLVPLRRRAASA
jgi:DNA-binding NarL/FixJ family response regulator